MFRGAGIREGIMLPSSASRRRIITCALKMSGELADCTMLSNALVSASLGAGVGVLLGSSAIVFPPFQSALGGDSAGGCSHVPRFSVLVLDKEVLQGRFMLQVQTRQTGESSPL